MADALFVYYTRRITETFGLPLEAIDDDVNHINRLNAALNEWKREGYPDPKARLDEPIFQGRISLRDALTTKPVDLELVRCVGELMRLEGGENA